MKITSFCVFSATLLLSSCAHIDGNYHAKYGEEKKDALHDNGGLVDYGPPTRYEEIKLEERELTAEIVSAIGVENLATVIAYDFLGNVIAFDRTNETINEETVYPKRTSQLAKPYTVTFIPYQGSHCVDRIDSLGNARTKCLPPHN